MGDQIQYNEILLRMIEALPDAPIATVARSARVAFEIIGEIVNATTPTPPPQTAKEGCPDYLAVVSPSERP